MKKTTSGIGSRVFGLGGGKRGKTTVLNEQGLKVRGGKRGGGWPRLLRKKNLINRGGRELTYKPQGPGRPGTVKK